jgi:hypothetical protein
VLNVRQDPESSFDAGFELLWKCLSTILQRSKDVKFWIFIDAVDELSSSSSAGFAERVTAIIDHDFNRKVKIVCSDRLAAHTNLHSNHLSIDMQRQMEVVDDVRRYIAAQIEDLSARGSIPWTHQTQIEESLANLSEGNFLQASLAWMNFHSGVSYWSPQVTKNRLDGFKRLSKEATAYYCSLLECIPEDSQDLARTAFTWVLGSRKPLNISELQHAIAISSGQN